MRKSNEEFPNLSLRKPPLKRSKTIPNPKHTHFSVSVSDSDEQWNYPSFLGTTTKKKKTSFKPHNLNLPKPSLVPPPPPPPPPPPSTSSSPLSSQLFIASIVFVPHSAYLQYKLTKLEDEKLNLCCQIDFCPGNERTSLQKVDGSFSYILNADSRTVALYIVVVTLILPFMLYKYLDYLPQIVNFLRRTNNNKEDVPLKKRVAYMVDVFFSIYPYAKLLALLFATLFLIGFGGLALYAVTGGSLAEALWHSWTYVADSGNHAETEGTGQRIVSVSISSGGMLIFAMMLGLVSDAISEKVDSLRKGKSEVIEKNHILILGWSDKLGSLLKQLAIANKSIGGGVIVVLAEKEKEEMEMDIAKLEFDFMGTSVICRSGSPLILADLKKVSVSKARAIIVLASDENADQSDARALRVVLSLTGVREGLGGHVVVEMSDLDNEPLVKLVGGELIETVVAHDVIGRLMIQCALQPGLAQIWEDILGFENAEFYIKRWPELDGLFFKDVLISFPDAIPCGVKVAADGGMIIINPDDSYVLRDGDEVLVIAEDDDTYAPGPLPEVHKGLCSRIRDPPKYPDKILFCGWRRDIDDMIMNQGAGILFAKIIMCPNMATPFGCGTILSYGGHALATRGLQGVSNPFKLVLEALLAPGSELWMFNEVPEKEREKKLVDGGLDVSELENIKLVHREGNAVIRRHLEGLPLETFDSGENEDLFILLLTLSIGGFDDKLCGEDVSELGTITVSSAGSLLLVVIVEDVDLIIVVVASKEVAEDEFRDVDLIFLVDLHGNTVAIVEDGDGIGLGVDGDLEGIHGRVVLLVVGGVDEDLVEDLVEAEDVGDGAVHHLVVLVHPQRLRVLPDGADVGVEVEEDELQLCLSLILILADESVEDSVAHSDSRSLATLLLIRDIQQASVKSIIISEILDSRTRNLVSVSRISDYVLSNELVSMALAMVAEDKQINRVLEELFAEEGNEMCTKAAELYLFDKEEVCFYDIMIRGRTRNEIVIGYRLANQDRAIINPSQKSLPRIWSIADVFVVIAKGD
ncbi:hypothetical protein JHK85_044582 [Glycine max]|nr:hypothetical protein JHK85_044582 [Glycine max]